MIKFILEFVAIGLFIYFAFMPEKPKASKEDYKKAE
jgi:hypothetical protein